jgi:hypothetical protein
MHSQMRSHFLESMLFEIASQRARRSLKDELCRAPAATLASVLV